MKFVIHYRSKSDPLFQPWPMVVEDTKHPGVLTVQPRNPCQTDNLIAFEDGFEDPAIYTHNPDWHTKCIGLSPVFSYATGRGIYSVQDYVVTGVDVHDTSPREAAPCTS